MFDPGGKHSVLPVVTCQTFPSAGPELGTMRKGGIEEVKEKGEVEKKRCQSSTIDSLPASENV